MDIALFSSLMNNLLHLNVMATERPELDFPKFEKKYCFHPVLQPELTAETLLHVAKEMQPNIFYSIHDGLGVCNILFYYERTCFILGPYVRYEYDENKMQSILMSAGFPASYSTPIRLYYSGIPLLGSSQIRSTAISCIRSLTGTTLEFDFCHIGKADRSVTLPDPVTEETLDYNDLQERYDRENEFLHCIEAGDVDNVISRYKQMRRMRPSSERLVNAVYQNTEIMMGMIRAMTRKAAERGGASIVDINEITQREVQRSCSTNDIKKQMQYTGDMVLELTEAVRKSRSEYGAFSKPIQRVIEHIRLNYSQKITLADLAKTAGLSESYLAKAFKKETGRTVFQYIAELRCKKAAELLKDTPYSIHDISAYVGYLDNNYFVKVFKKQFGRTPSDYREHPNS